MIAVVALNFEDIFYNCGLLIPIYWGGSLVIFGTAAFVEAGITFASMRGSIVNDKPRIGT